MKKYCKHFVLSLYLLLVWQYASAQDPTRIKVYNESDFRALSVATTTEGQSYNNAIISLEADIVIQGDELRPIGLPPAEGENSFPFQGEFDGQGHTITLKSPLAVVTWKEEDDRKCVYTGVFGLVGVAGLIKNLNVIVDDVSIAIRNTSGSGNLGILAGYNAGLIQNCSVSGEVSLSSDILYNFYHFGCIAGIQSSDGITISCTNNAKVSTENVSVVGGIIGASYSGVLVKCTNRGAIISDGFSDFGGDAKSVGGVVGESSSNTNREIPFVINCLNYGRVQVAENAISAGGVVGKCMGDVMVFYCGNSGDLVSDAEYSGGVIGQMVRSEIVGSYHAGRIRSKKRITSSNSLIGIRWWGDDEIVKDCYILNTEGDQKPQSSVNAKIISPDSFVRKANSNFSKEKKALLELIENEGWKDLSLFTPYQWTLKQEQLFPSFD